MQIVQTDFFFKKKEKPENKIVLQIASDTVFRNILLCEFIYKMIHFNSCHMKFNVREE